MSIDLEKREINFPVRAQLQEYLDMVLRTSPKGAEPEVPRLDPAPDETSRSIVRKDRVDVQAIRALLKEFDKEKKRVDGLFDIEEWLLNKARFMHK